MKFDDASKIVVVVKDPERFQEKSIKLDERFSFVSGGNSRSEFRLTELEGKY